MPDRPRTAQDVKALVEERDIRFIRIWFTDVLGQLKSFSIGAAELDDAFEHGILFDGSSITGFNPIEESDMLAMPDPSTFAVLPWRPDDDARRARVLPTSTRPRARPTRATRATCCAARSTRLRGLGFDRFEVGAEPEYFLFRDRHSTEPLDEGGYFDLTTLDAGSDVRRETVLALEQLGIDVEYSHHEGGPSQHEVDLRHGRRAEDGRRRA